MPRRLSSPRKRGITASCKKRKPDFSAVMCAEPPVADLNFAI
jgi:hypothetical protein